VVPNDETILAVLDQPDRPESKGSPPSVCSLGQHNAAHIQIKNTRTGARQCLAPASNLLFPLSEIDKVAVYR
jgi:hypothetical protein